MKRRNFRNSRSGQIIVITALLVALVLLSTAVFVIGTEKDVPSNANDPASAFPAYQQAARNTLISALAYVTDGGSPSILAADLNQLESTIAKNSYQSIIVAAFTPLNQAPYQNGILISWGTNGQGISSGYVTLQINSTGDSSTSSLECFINVTTAISISGSYSQLGANTTVNLTMNLQNDGAPASAKTLSLYFKDSSGGWQQADSPSISDFGNGTYTAAFNAETAMLNFPIQISAICQDQRGITVIANSTFTNTG
jgi:hypothetical protein